MLEPLGKEHLLFQALAQVLYVLVQNELSPSDLCEQPGHYTLKLRVQTQHLVDELKISNVFDGIVDVGFLEARELDEVAKVYSAQAFDQSWVDFVAGGLELSKGMFIFGSLPGNIVRHFDDDGVKFEVGM